MTKLLCSCLFSIILLAISVLHSGIVNSKSSDTDTTLYTISDSVDYAENVHMYICIQALMLLKDKFPQYNFTEFDRHTGTMNDFGDRQWQTGLITTGAYREDKEDVVFDIRGPFGFFASNSHFWNSDNRTGGDHTFTNLNILGINYNYPNAYTKIKRYEDGNWQEWNGSGYGGKRYIEYNAGNGKFYRYSYHTRGLAEFYKTNRIWLESIINTLGETEPVRNEIRVADIVKDRIAWEVLGRIAHLNQDLSVSAHTKNDVHVRIWDGGDCYHNYIDDGAYLNYNWQTAKQSGGFFNPYENNDDPLRYILYTSAQLADHFPSGPDCTEIPQQHSGNNSLPGGSNQMIENYYSRLGPSPQNITDVSAEADYCFNHAIRSTSALFYWFGVETGIFNSDSFACPVINSFSKNLPDNNIYREETLALTCNASGSDLSYEWFFSVCDSNAACTEPIPGLTFTADGNRLFIRNINFKNRYTCSYYDSLCYQSEENNLSEGPLNFLIGVKVKNRLGQQKKFFNFNTHSYFSPLETLRPPEPPVSGCPWLLVSDGYQMKYRNSLLKNSQHTKNYGMDITDNYVIEEEPYINLKEKSVILGIKEISDDENLTDQIRIRSIDYPKDSKIGVTENGDVILYYPDEIISPSLALLSGRNVSKETVYDSLYGIKVRGKESDKLYLEFPDISGRRYLSGNVPDSIAVILDPNSPGDNSGNPVIKNVTGVITAKDTDGNENAAPADFGMRQLRSDLFIPLFGSKKVKSAEIYWNRDFEYSYIGALPVYYGGFTERNLDLTSAFDYKTGDVKELLLRGDKNYYSADSSTFLILNFKPSGDNPPAGFNRSYVFSTTGRSIKNNSSSESISDRAGIKSSGVFQNRLSGNFPNPFNPVTNVEFGISESGFVSLKVHDMLGKEVATLVNENLPPGYYTVKFNGSNLSSGVYFCIMKTNDIIITTRMILMK